MTDIRSMTVAEAWGLPNGARVREVEHGAIGIVSWPHPGVLRVDWKENCWYDRSLRDYIGSTEYDLIFNVSAHALPLERVR